jgi:hypothetical protein
MPSHVSIVAAILLLPSTARSRCSAVRAMFEARDKQQVDELERFVDSDGNPLSRGINRDSLWMVDRECAAIREKNLEWLKWRRAVEGAYLFDRNRHERRLRRVCPFGRGLSVVTSNRSTISMVSSGNPTPTVRPPGVKPSNSGWSTGIDRPSARYMSKGRNGLAYNNLRTWLLVICVSLSSYIGWSLVSLTPVFHRSSRTPSANRLRELRCAAARP